jgi:DNA-binding LacI/PurR family transcriptional regulator
VDALLVVALPLQVPERELLQALDLPLACVAESMPDVHVEGIDNVAAARLAVRHLLDLGHRRIASVGGDSAGHLAFGIPDLRSRGYRQEMADAGLLDAGVLAGDGHGEWEADGGYTAAGGERAVAELLTRTPRPTAVFCHSDEMAFGALRAIRHAGLTCPDDISVIGFDDHELAVTWDLTTIAQPVAEQGAAAVRHVVRTLAGPFRGASADASAGESADGRVQHPVRLVIRSTTAAATSD